jgi:hypothetical protein
MNEFLAWFTPERRKAIYGVVTAIGALLLAAGLITDVDAVKITGIATQVLSLLTNFMACMNTNTDSGTKEFIDGSDI